MIIDDPHNPTQIHSRKMREKAIEWYEKTFATRLNDKNKGAILLVMQRLHEEDLSGFLLANSKRWLHLKIPVIASEDINYKIRDKDYYLLAGEVLHKMRDEQETLTQIEEEIGRQNFAAQYMQEPISQNSSMLKNEDIIYYDVLEDFEYIVQSWDTAIKIASNSDYTVCTTWGIKQNKYFLLDMLRAKFEYPELKQKVIFQAEKFKPKFIIIEDKASGQSIIQDLTLETSLIVKKYKPLNNKITRFAATIPFFQAGRILFPNKAPWLNVMLNELIAFPNSKNDDIIDSISQFIEVIKSNKNNNFRIRTI